MCHLIKPTALLVLASTLIFLMWCQPATAQSEDQKRLITIKSLKVEQVGSAWQIRISGVAPDVPDGTKVEFQMTWRSQALQVFEVTIKSGQFEEELKPKRTFVTSDKFVFRTEIHKKDQNSSVKKKIESDPASFSPAAESWVDYHFDREFRLATDEEVAKELAEISEFFVERYTVLGKLDKQVTDQAQSVRDGSEFMKKDSFEDDKWRKWFDKDVVKPLVKLQKEITEKQDDERFTAYRRTLFFLSEIVGGVAKRVLKEQEDLFSEKKVTLAKEDQEPQDLSTVTQRRRVSKNYLADLVKQIRSDLGLDKLAPSGGQPEPASGGAEKEGE